MFAFQVSPLNRHGDIRHHDTFINRIWQSEQAHYLPVYRQTIATRSREETYIPHWQSYSELVDIFGSLEQKHLIYLGEKNSEHFFTYRLKDESSLDQLKAATPESAIELLGLRELFKSLPAEDSYLCNVAIAMEHWHNTHQFCGYCGSETYSNKAGFVRTCSNKSCQQEHFPRTDSAVICAITNNDKILLGRQTSWPEHRYSVIAGFVEPGETLEQAVAREGFEETGLRLKNINYFKSQPWPFPQSLMVGFTAETQDYDIQLRDKELENAKWFTRDDIRILTERQELELPSVFSISRELINQWLKCTSC
ncbi:hypothetical protein GCM10009123_08930 [Kangiella japonica]|uniref:NAD(+) diphosphatase n=1 Tax=Kangiella japonica TaxID=647384 RepID=A0ABP3CGC5_9GAMM